jgi:hypothetical protein
MAPALFATALYRRADLPELFLHLGAAECAGGFQSLEPSASGQPIVPDARPLEAAIFLVQHNPQRLALVLFLFEVTRSLSDFHTSAVYIRAGPEARPARASRSALTPSVAHRNDHAVANTNRVGSNRGKPSEAIVIRWALRFKIIDFILN